MKRKGMSDTLTVILAIVAMIVLIVTIWALRYALLPVRTVTSQISGAEDIIDKTYDADNAIYNYEWFKTQYEKIEAEKEKLENLDTEIEDFVKLYGSDANVWDFETKRAHSRLTSTRLGLRNHLNDLIAEYNARSKMANRNIFQDKLPVHVDEMLW